MRCACAPPLPMLRYLIGYCAVHATYFIARRLRRKKRSVREVPKEVRTPFPAYISIFDRVRLLLTASTSEASAPYGRERGQP